MTTLLGIVAEDNKGHGPSRPAVDDADEATLDAIPGVVPHRHVDIPLAAAHEEGRRPTYSSCAGKTLTREDDFISGYVRVYIIAPSGVYGLATGKLVDAGIQNPVPTWVLLSSKIAAARGQLGKIGPGTNLWSTVEIHDCEYILTIFIINPLL